jgi:hydroxypyruvate reductase
VQYFRGGHPVPNSESWRAAEAVLRELKQQGPAALVIFLLSGGGSSLLEKPIYGDISPDELAATYDVLVLSGATIVEINAIRKHLSAVKGGRLAQAAAPAQQVSILVSDVPDNAPDALASGPTMPDSSTVEDCYGVAEEYGLLPQLPESVRRLFANRTLEETPKTGDEAFARSRWWTVLSNAQVRQAAAAAGARAGFAVTIDNSCDDWDYARAGDYLLGRVRELRRGVSRVCLISGGEVTVRVENGGQGGRNQQFALYCAQKIAGESITVLSAGTDGIDGNSPASGAGVDGTTLERARGRGLDAAAALKRFDAFPFFEALGDAIVTGPTGNNLRDVRVLLAY